MEVVDRAVEDPCGERSRAVVMDSVVVTLDVNERRSVGADFAILLRAGLSTPRQGRPPRPVVEVLPEGAAA